MERLRPFQKVGTKNAKDEIQGVHTRDLQEIFNKGACGGFATSMKYINKIGLSGED